MPSPAIYLPPGAYCLLPVLDASAQDIPTVEINPEASEVSALVDYRIQADAAEALTALWGGCRRRMLRSV